MNAIRNPLDAAKRKEIEDTIALILKTFSENYLRKYKERLIEKVITLIH